MKIAVLSAADRCGATASVLLMASAIADTQERSVRVCYTGENNSIKRYVGKDAGARDATMTISQVSKLLEAHAIAPESLSDYCTKLIPNMDVMDSWDEALTEEEMISLLTFTYSRNTTDYIFCDMAQELDSPVAQSVLSVSDAVVIVSEPSKASLTAVREMQESPLWPKDVPCMLLIAKYNEAIDSVSNLAKVSQFKLRSTCKLHYNPLITKYCSTGQLLTIVPYAIKRDPRVVELNNDLKECTQFFLSLNNAKMKWEK